MIKIDFNKDFGGFQQNEDLLVDTGIILALLNEYDAWHTTVKDLFSHHILNSDNDIYLYIHAGIINEVTHLSSKPLKQYMNKHSELGFSSDDIENTTKATLFGMKEMLDKDYLLLLESNKDVLLNQIKYSQYFGSMDALTASVANEYGISILTLDRRFTDHIVNIQQDFSNIPIVYYTIPRHRDY